jgi:hypothetical protein
MKGTEGVASSPAHPELPRQLVSQVGYVEEAFDARRRCRTFSTAYYNCSTTSRIALSGQIHFLSTVQSRSLSQREVLMESELPQVSWTPG